MKSTFKILFFIRKDKINAEGKSVIYVRLTINGSACQFSTKNEVSVKIWDAKNYRATGRSEEATNINSFLDFMRKNLLEIYMELSQNNEPVTPTAIRDKFMGKVEKKNDTLLSLFAEFIERQRPLVGIDITRSTFNKYDLTYRRLEEFLSTKQKKRDIPMREIDHNFVCDFHTFLKVDKKLSINSSEKLMRIFKRITTFAFKTNLTEKDPFALYTIKKVKTNRGFLTEEEFSKFYNFQTFSTKKPARGAKLMHNLFTKGEKARPRLPERA